MTELSSIITELEYRKSERSLASFTKKSWEILEPATPLQWNWHHDLICEYLEACELGQIRRLIINMPPRNMKSILVSICFPAWIWTNNPSRRFLCGSYSQSLSSKHSIDCRTLIESNWYRNRWGNKVVLTSDQNMKTEFTNTSRGHRIATSIMGTATGKGGDYVIADDPHDTTGAQSQIERENTINTMRQKYFTRLDDKKTGRTIIVMQRLHEADATGEFLRDGGWDHLCIPAICEKKTTVVFPLSSKVIERDEGDILHPEREDQKVLSELKVHMGSTAFAGQYQQSPAAAEGNIIKREWLRFYTNLPPKIDEQIIAMDATFTGKSTSDYVSIQTWARAGSQKFLLDQVYSQMGITDTINALIQVTRRFPKAALKLIENKANGPAIEDLLKLKVSGIVLWEPQGDKVARMNAVAPQFEAGNVLLPHPSLGPWAQDLVDELVTFPNAVHDDRSDTLSMSLIRLEESCSSGVGVMRMVRA